MSTGLILQLDWCLYESVIEVGLDSYSAILWYSTKWLKTAWGQMAVNNQLEEKESWKKKNFVLNTSKKYDME